jgi:glycosyltransferase involved in cell wall biosynthesis
MFPTEYVRPSSHPASSRSDADPLVTIAIPTLNRASWLKECVFSALSQTYRNIEVIVSDNASTDETQEVLKAILDPRLHVVRQKSNVGLLPNWNACLAEARGEYFVIVSDDDRIAPQLLERSVALAKRDPQIPIVIALSDVYFSGIARTWRAHNKLKTGIWNGIDILQELLTLPIFAGISTFMFRTEALRARGGFPVDFPHAADTAVWIPLLFVGSAGFVDEPGGTIRLHNARETSRLAIDLRLSDSKKAIDLIVSMADSSIEDPKKRERVKSLAKRFFARSALAHLAQYRREGATLKSVLPLMWQWRAELENVGMGHVLRLATTLTALVLPVRMIQWSHRFRRAYRQRQ